MSKIDSWGKKGEVWSHFFSNEALLETKRPQIIAIVGAGGKSSLLFVLAHFLAHKQKKVLIATTTKMYLPQEEQVDKIVIGSLAKQLSVVGNFLQPGCIVAYAPAYENGKMLAITDKDLAALYPLTDFIILEADGAAGKPLKAPRSYEPAIPENADIVFHVSGFSAFTKTWRQACHKAERARALLGITEDEVITEEDVARLLLHPLGGRKNIPQQAKLFYVLNQADQEEAMVKGRMLAHSLLQGGAEQVLLTCLAKRELKAVFRKNPLYAAIVLAAGEAKRMGGTKLLLPWKNGTILDATLQFVLNSPCQQLVLVVGHEKETLLQQINCCGLEVAINLQYQEGQSTSLKAGLASLAPSVQAAFFVLGDQPLLAERPQLLTEMLLYYQEKRKNGPCMIVPAKDGKRGNPVLVDKAFFPDIWQLSGDTGARCLLTKYTEQVFFFSVKEDAVLLDCDTPAAYAALQKAFGEDKK